MSHFKQRFFFTIRLGNWMLSNRGLEHFVEFSNGRYKWHAWKKITLTNKKQKHK